MSAPLFPNPTIMPQSYNTDKELNYSRAALKHPDKLGAGARKREKIKDPEKKIGTVLKEYERGTLNSGSGHRAKSKAQALAIGYSEAKKDFKLKGKAMSETIIPSSARNPKPAKNMKFVNSRSGGPNEHKMTKNSSMKHENPEFFKRQSDRKNADQFGFQMKNK